MTEADIKAVVVKHLAAIAPEADLAALAGDANIRRELDIDSYDFLNFLIALNKETGVEIPEADYGKLGTFKDMITYLAAHAG
ncbi:MAG: phosphopantetheine-binding protein [Chthoniobacter sp.]|nr:phosphopantetheine-binding protein [Chthoniobacter sp.]